MNIPPSNFAMTASTTSGTGFNGVAKCPSNYFLRTNSTAITSSITKSTAHLT